MDKSEVIKQLEKCGNFSGLYEVTTFKGYRTNKEGNHQEVNIEIFDAGEEKSHRYHVYATTEDGKAATGNPQSSLEAAIAIVHWYKLDK